MAIKDRVQIFGNGRNVSSSQTEPTRNDVLSAFIIHVYNLQRVSLEKVIETLDQPVLTFFQPGVLMSLCGGD